MGSSGKIILPADIQNRTRQIWIPANSFMLITGAPSLVDVGGNGVPGWALDPSSVEGVSSALVLPADTTNANITIIVYWTVLTTSTNTVRWGFGTSLITPNSGNLGLSLGESTGTPAGVSGRLLTTQLSTDAFSGVSETAEQYSQIHIYRNATDAADTFANDVYMLGTLFKYTSDS